MTTIAFPLQSLALPLFLLADRPDRFAKAVASAANAVILDLEDAVAPSARRDARVRLDEIAPRIAEAPTPVLLRINGVGTGDHADDLAVACRLPPPGSYLPKRRT